MPPRRFARMWEFDRNGLPASGYPEDQQRVRDVFSDLATFDGPLDRVLYAVDRKINRTGRTHYYFGFVYDPHWFFGYGRTGGTGIQIFLHPDPEVRPHPSWWQTVAIHEFGHVVGNELFNPIDTSEDWAIAFELWVRQGQPEDDPVWERLVATGEMKSVVHP